MLFLPETWITSWENGPNRIWLYISIITKRAKSSPFSLFVTNYSWRSCYISILILAVYFFLLQSSFMATSIETGLKEVDIYNTPVLESIVITTLKWDLTTVQTRGRDTRAIRQISNSTQKENVAKMWSLLSGSYLAYLLPPKSFHLATSSNLSGPLYANQSGLPNINMCFSFEKRGIGSLSLLSLDFKVDILFLSSISWQNETKEGNNFNHIKLIVWSLVLCRGIRPEGLIHQFSLFFSLSFAGMFGGKSFSTLDFIENIKNYIESSLKQLKMQLSVT